MAETKRGHERSGRGRRRQYYLREIEDEVAALREAGPTTFETPMVANYTVPPDEEPMRMECWRFEELATGSSSTTRTARSSRISPTEA